MPTKKGSVTKLWPLYVELFVLIWTLCKCKASRKAEKIWSDSPCVWMAEFLSWTDSSNRSNNILSWTDNTRQTNGFSHERADLLFNVYNFLFNWSGSKNSASQDRQTWQLNLTFCRKDNTTTNTRTSYNQIREITVLLFFTHTWPTHFISIAIAVSNCVDRWATAMFISVLFAQNSFSTVFESIAL